MKRGMVVRSLSGHDKGKCYIVVSVKENYAFLCDGKTKLLKNPKRKNCKHLENLGKYTDLSGYNPLYDAHIRKELKGL